MKMPSFVTLRSGLTVRVDALLLVLDLESRGIGLERYGDDVLLVAYRSPVTDEDRARIQMFKSHVLSVIDYVASAAVQ